MLNMRLSEVCPEHLKWLGPNDRVAEPFALSLMADGLHWRVELSEDALVARGHRDGYLVQEVAVDGNCKTDHGCN